MLQSVLLLLLLLLGSGAQTAYYGTVYTYYVGDYQQSSYSLIYDFKLGYSSCVDFNTSLCSGNCSWITLHAIDESRDEWCQKVFVQTYYTSYQTVYNELFPTANWIENRNGIRSSLIPLLFDLRNRSDINKPNSSPQTTIIPLLRVPSNCQRNINLLVFDPNGDEFRCRYAAGSECFNCTPPSVLSLSSACILSFSPTNSSAEGPYAVQLIIEDFPRQTITLTNSSGSEEVKNTSNAISKVPVQFVFRVDPAAPSCTEGLYLPTFLPPTPENGAQIYTNVSQTVEINIQVSATAAMITELLFSGPTGVSKSSLGSRNFTLTWTPSERDGGRSHTFCFVAQANSSNSVYQSDLRCIIVTTGESPSRPTFNVTTQLPPTMIPPTATSLLTPTTAVPSDTPTPEPYYILALNAKILTTLSLEHDSATITELIKGELQRQGLPIDIEVQIKDAGDITPGA